MKIRPLYIFDLDGTLALIDHRRPILDNLDNSNRWNDFYNACDKDIANEPIIKIYNALMFLGNEIWIFSGRSEIVKDKTIQWLKNNTTFYEGNVYGNKIIMRQENDYTPDEKLKNLGMIIC